MTTKLEQSPAPLPPLLATLVRAAQSRAALGFSYYGLAYDNGHGHTESLMNADLLALASAWEELAGRAAQLQTELEEARKLISPEVQRAAALLMRRVDRHPDACCLKCSEGLAERDAARAEVARLEAGIRNYCMPGCPMRDKIG